MVRQPLIVAFCLLVATAPLADSLCFSGCSDSQVAAHHSCAKQHDDATAINAVPHSCPDGDQTLLGSIEVRHTVAVAALPLSTRFDQWLPIVRFGSDPRSPATDFSPELLTPLRI
jgi:hypothetical protein